MGPFVINLENLSKPSPKTPEILSNLDFRIFVNPVTLAGVNGLLSKQALSIPCFLERFCYVSNCFIHNVHHSSIGSSYGIIYKGILISIFFGCFNRGVNILKCHVKEQRAAGIMRFHNLLCTLQFRLSHTFASLDHINQPIRVCVRFK